MICESLKCMNVVPKLYGNHIKVFLDDEDLNIKQEEIETLGKFTVLGFLTSIVLLYFFIRFISMAFYCDHLNLLNLNGKLVSISLLLLFLFVPKSSPLLMLVSYLYLVGKLKCA